VILLEDSHLSTDKLQWEYFVVQFGNMHHCPNGEL